MMHKAVKDASPKLYKESFFIHRTDTRAHFSMLHICAGLGSSGKGAHAPGETINLKEYPILIQRAAILIYRLTHE